MTFKTPHFNEKQMKINGGEFISSDSYFRLGFVKSRLDLTCRVRTLKHIPHFIFVKIKGWGELSALQAKHQNL